MSADFPLVIWNLCFLLHNQVGMRSVFPFVMCTNAVLSVTKPGCDELSVSFCDVSQFCAFCYTAELGCGINSSFPCVLWTKTVLCDKQSGWEGFSLSFCDVSQCSAFCYTTKLGWVQSFLLWREPIQCFLLHNQVGMGSVFPFVKRTNSVLSVTQPSWDECSLSFCAGCDELSLSFCDVNQCRAFC